MRYYWISLGLVLVLSGCGKSDDGAKKDAGAAAKMERKTPITTVQAKLEPVRVTEESAGQVESKSAPLISAETAGQVVNVLVDVGSSVKAGQTLAVLESQDYKLARSSAEADVKRLQSLIDSQRRQVDRYRDMVAEKFVTQSVFDEAKSQLGALEEQLSSARNTVLVAELNLAKTTITAPIAGQVEQRMIAAGNFVKAGDPAFRLSTRGNLRIRLPFPETVAGRLHVGLPVELAIATAPDTTITGKISEIQPVIGNSNRAMNVFVEMENPGQWQPGASVKAKVILEERAAAVMVPEISVVRRPAGDVVYVIVQNKAQQRVVKTGQKRDGMVEILDNIKVGETIAVDGAGFLTEGANVEIQDVKS